MGRCQSRTCSASCTSSASGAWTTPSPLVRACSHWSWMLENVGAYTLPPLAAGSMRPATAWRTRTSVAWPRKMLTNSLAGRSGGVLGGRATGPGRRGACRGRAGPGAGRRRRRRPAASRRASRAVAAQPGHHLLARHQRAGEAQGARPERERRADQQCRGRGCPCRCRRSSRSMTRGMGKGRAVTIQGSREMGPMAGTSAMRPLEGIGRPLTRWAPRGRADRRRRREWAVRATPP